MSPSASRRECSATGFTKPMTTRTLTFAERTTMGICPVCNAADGSPCITVPGIAYGPNAFGDLPQGAAHADRIRLAPLVVVEDPGQ
jgi:hypothetical protein